MNDVKLLLPYPPSANHYWRHVGARILVSAEGRAYRTRIAQLIASARVRGEAPLRPLSGRLAVGILMRPADKARRDIDNIQKATLDALTYAKLWLDDSQVDALVVLRGKQLIGGAIDLCVTDVECFNSFLNERQAA